MSLKSKGKFIGVTIINAFDWYFTALKLSSNVYGGSPKDMKNIGGELDEWADRAERRYQ